MPLGGDIIQASDVIDPAQYSTILRETAAQAIGTSSATAITFSTEDWDPAAGHTGSGSTWTAPVAGFYLITGSGTVVANAAGRVELRIRAAGTDITQAAQPNSATSAPHMSVATMQQLAAGDAVSLILFQTSGGSLNTSVANGNPRLTVTFQAEA